MVKISVRHGTKVVQTNCEKVDCQKGGLAKDDILDHIVKCPSTVEKEGERISRTEGSGDSFFIKTENCMKKIGQYHTINDNKNEISSFLSMLAVRSKLDNKLPELIKWGQKVLSTHNWVPNINFDIFVVSFLKVRNIVLNEQNAREDHLKNCVCLSDKAHSERLRQLNICNKYFHQIFKIVESFVLKTDNITFSDPQLSENYITAKFLKQFDFEFLQAKCLKVAKDNLYFGVLNKDGVSFNLNLLDIKELFQLEPYVKDLSFNFKKVCYEQAILLIEKVINNSNAFNMNSNPFVVCVELDSVTKNVSKIALDFSLLSNFISKTEGLQVDISFLTNLIETKYKPFIYKSCFSGLLEHHINIIQKVCKVLNKINIDPDIKAFLIQLCQSFTKISYPSNIDILDLRKQIKSFKLGETAYSSFIRQRNLLPLFPNLTFDLINDLKILPHSLIIDFFIFYENEWKKYEEYSRLIFTGEQERISRT